MPLSNKRAGFVSAGVAASHLLFAAAAQARSVSFIARQAFDAGSFPVSVAVGDFNGDGALDLAVANQDFGRVSVLLGNGDGSFQAPRSLSAGSHPTSVAVGDFNGDGALDLAVGNRDSNNVSVLLGDGDGSFQVARDFGAGRGPFFHRGGGVKGARGVD